MVLKVPNIPEKGQDYAALLKAYEMLGFLWTVVFRFSLAMPVFLLQNRSLRFEEIRREHSEIRG
jgi:hypothetical protein